MIIEELNEIINNPKDKNLGFKLNNIYDEFRDGRDPNDLLILLNSNDVMIGYGCDICCEISIKDFTLRNYIIKKLNEILSKNMNSFNRERAFDALYGFYMDENDIEGFNKICNQYKNDYIDEISYFATNFLKDCDFKRD